MAICLMLLGRQGHLLALLVQHNRLSADLLRLEVSSQVLVLVDLNVGDGADHLLQAGQVLDFGVAGVLALGSRLLAAGHILDQLVSLGNHLIDATNHVKCHLWQVIVLALNHTLEASNGCLDVHVLSGRASEHLSDLEGLRQEALHLAGAAHSQLILLTQLIHTQNGNDILQVLVVLQDLLHTTGYVVVLFADNAGVKHARGGVQGIHSGVDTQLSNVTGQHGGGIQVGEGGGRGRICQIIGRHVHGLHGGNGALLGGGNSLLEGTHICGQGGLVTHSGGNATQQGRHLGVGLGKAEDVVHEEQHVLALIAEELSHSQTSQSHTGTGSRGLVHLTIHQGHLGLVALLTHMDDTRLNHLVVQIVALTGALTHTGEHGKTTMGLGHVVDQLHNQHSLAHTGTSKQTNLTTLLVGG
mmetsp:Transcript_14100/g.38107  ORF Transcript_14100/g.38107 Transcript_14100/m.38107 type:complete len:413 (-) Transcript_14100:656-1894(-)